MHGFASHAKALKSISRGNKESLKNFEMDDDIIRYTFSKSYSGNCVGNGVGVNEVGMDSS